MALFDFMNRGRAAQQPSDEAGKSQPQRSETAKEMYTRQAAEQKAAEKPITPEIRAKAEEAVATVSDSAAQRGTTTSPSAPNGDNNSPQAMRQNMMQQDKAAPALSPTSMNAGTSAAEKQSRESAEPAKTTQNPPARPQTIARRPPSWER